MKKSDEDDALKKECLKKLNLKMKFCFLTACFVLFQLSANSVMSQKRIEFKYDNVSLKNILNEIKSQTGYRFFYNVKEIDDNQKISLSADHETIREVLSKLSVKLNFDFIINENQIVLKKKRITSFQSQSIEIKGTVTEVNGLPLSGANILEKGTINGTQADFDGNFTISVKDESAVLMFSYVGFATKEVPVVGLNEINVVLEESAAGLDEVVVVGYGTVSKKDLTGSVSTINSEEINAVAVDNVGQALRGRSAGVNVTQNSGQPGARISINIRGGNSIQGNNQPLMVIDGFPSTGDISFLNPNDIQSMEILKDASATSIYGARGANGVIIITTKKGKVGKNTIEVNSYTGFQSIIKDIDLMSPEQYAVVVNELAEAEGIASRYDPNNLPAHSNWKDLVLRSGTPITNHNITFTGGSENTKYSVSGGLFNQEGIIVGSDFNRINLRTSLNQKVNEVIDISSNIILSKSENNRIHERQGAANLWQTAVTSPPILPIYDTNGDLNTSIRDDYFFTNLIWQHPLAIKEIKDERFSNRILANLDVNFGLTKDLSLRVSVGAEGVFLKDRYYSPSILDISSPKGLARSNNTESLSLINENILTYNKVINENHSFNVTAGITYQNFREEYNFQEVSGFTNDILEDYNLGAAENAAPPSSGISEWALGSALGRINYSLFNKYLFTASIRADGSSRFGKDNKWGYFPSAAFAWKAGNENFLKHQEFLTDLKFRTSWGLTGNTAISPYQSLNRLTPNNTIFGNQLYIGFAPNSLPNPELKWETTEQIDLGIDFGVFGGKLNFVFDYYVKTTDELLADIPLPPSSGYISTNKNIGSIRNSGIELSVSSPIIDTKDVQWKLTANVSTLKNKVVDIPEGSDIFASGIEVPFAGPINIVREGEPLGAFYGFIHDGFDENGNYKYKDITNDGVLNEEDKVILGSPYPDLIYGVNSQLSYKNLSLDFFLQGTSGNELFLNSEMILPNGGTNSVPNSRVDYFDNYWTPNRTEGVNYPALGSQTENPQPSSRNIFDASYLRLKAITLSYDIPFKPNFLQNAQIYVQGQNLFTITDYPGFEPEINSYGQENSRGSNPRDALRIGIDEGSYPTAKTYLLGLKLRF